MYVYFSFSICLHSEWLVGFFFKIPKFWTFSKNEDAVDRTFEDSTSFFNSSISLFNLARRFWNHVITWALLKPNCVAISSLSAGDKYFWYMNRRSNSKIWLLVNAVLDFRFFFGCCRLLNKFKWLPFSEKKKTQNRKITLIKWH